jgi:hypothetical protein
MVECWVESAGSDPKQGKGGVGFYGGTGVGGGGGCVGMRSLLNFILEVSEYGIEDSISGKGVIIIKVVEPPQYVCGSALLRRGGCLFSGTVTV